MFRRQPPERRHEPADGNKIDSKPFKPFEAVAALILLSTSMWPMQVGNKSVSTDVCSSVAERLNSDDLSSQAWGAYFAAQCGRKDMVPEILRKLEALDPEFLGRSVPSQHVWAGRAMIDSLIDLRTAVPATNLTAISGVFPVEGVILMMQSPRDDVELLLSSRQRKPDSNVWIAASTALVKMRSPKIAPALLREVPFQISIELSDDGLGHPSGSFGSILGGVQEQALPSDFPPVSLYQLVTERVPGDQTVSDGPIDIYERRLILTPGQDQTWTPLPEIACYDCLRIQYLAKLAEVPPAVAYAAIHTAALCQVDATSAPRWNRAMSLKT